MHQCAAERVRIEEMVDVIAGVIAARPGLAQLGQRAGTEGAEQQHAAGLEHARDLREDRVEIVAPLQHQAAEYEVE